MMKDSREEILRKVKLGLYGDPEHKEGSIPTRDEGRDFRREAEELERDRLLHIDSLIESFIKELLNVNTVVHGTETEDELKAYIIELVREKGISSFVMWESDYLNSLGLKELLEEEGLRIR